MYRCEHQISRATFNLEKLCIKFIDNLISYMHSRLPNTSPLSAFGVMSLIFDLVDVQTPFCFPFDFENVFWFYLCCCRNASSFIFCMSCKCNSCFLLNFSDLEFYLFNFRYISIIITISYHTLHEKWNLSVNSTALRSRGGFHMIFTIRIISLTSGAEVTPFSKRY